MFCSNCGFKLPDNSKFCINCGEKLSPIDTKSDNKVELDMRLAKSKDNESTEPIQKMENNNNSNDGETVCVNDNIDIITPVTNPIKSNIPEEKPKTDSLNYADTVENKVVKQSNNYNSNNMNKFNNNIKNIYQDKKKNPLFVPLVTGVGLIAVVIIALIIVFSSSLTGSKITVDKVKMDLNGKEVDGIKIDKAKIATLRIENEIESKDKKTKSLSIYIKGENNDYKYDGKMTMNYIYESGKKWYFPYNKIDTFSGDIKPKEGPKVADLTKSLEFIFTSGWSFSKNPAKATKIITSEKITDDEYKVKFEGVSETKINKATFIFEGTFKFSNYEKKWSSYDVKEEKGKVTVEYTIKEKPPITEAELKKFNVGRIFEFYSYNGVPIEEGNIKEIKINSIDYTDSGDTIDINYNMKYDNGELNFNAEDIKMTVVYKSSKWTIQREYNNDDKVTYECKGVSDSQVKYDLKNFSITDDPRNNKVNYSINKDNLKEFKVIKKEKNKDGDFVIEADIGVEVSGKILKSKIFVNYRFSSSKIYSYSSYGSKYTPIG